MLETTIQPTSQGILPKLFTSFIFLAFLIGGSFLEYKIASDFSETLATHFWTATDCTIDTAGIDEKPPYKFNVGYSYTYNGQNYSSNVLSNNYNGSTDYYDVQTLFDRYIPGSQAICRVDPRVPNRAVLQTRSLWTGFSILFPLIFIVIGGGLLYLTWRPAHPQTQPRPPVNLKHPMLAAGIFCALFFAVGVTIQAFFIPTVLRGRAAQTWPAEPCIISHARIASHTSNGNHGSHTTYSVEVLYHYRHDGKRYGSSRYAISNSSSSDYSSARQQADELARQRNTECYVNPLDPADAVLSRDYAIGAAVMAVTSAIFMLFGAGGMILTHRQAKNDHLAKIEEHLTDTNRTAKVLKPAISIRLKFVIGLITTLIWNGFVALLACIIYSRRGTQQPQIILFLIVFGAVGLFLVGTTLRNARQLFYPTPHLTLTTHPLRLGEASEIRWDWLGRNDRITRLKLAIAVYALPNNQIGYGHLRTQSPLWQQEILDTTHPMDIQSGRHTFIIPPDAMPSSANNSRIVWAILLDADLSQPAQLKQEFPISITG
jgi:Protein of unknown function (DUF3592)